MLANAAGGPLFRARPSRLAPSPRFSLFPCASSLRTFPRVPAVLLPETPSHYSNLSTSSDPHSDLCDSFQRCSRVRSYPTFCFWNCQTPPPQRLSCKLCSPLTEAPWTAPHNKSASGLRVRRKFRYPAAALHEWGLDDFPERVAHSAR